MNIGLDPMPLWGMTASEISDRIAAERARNGLHLARLYKAGEASSFNTAALCLTAFNAPQRFPKTMSEAFTYGGYGEKAAGSSEDFAEIAKHLNKTLT